ncbi:MAG: hypothetical protein WDW36_003613 [Sanguina aurantia]
MFIGKVQAADLPSNVRIHLYPNEKAGVWSTLVAVASLTFYVGFMNWFIMLCVASFFSRAALYATIVLLTSLALPAGPVLWPAFTHLWVFSTWRHYFKFSFLSEEILKPHKRYVLAEFPHGAFPIGAIVAGTTVQILWPSLKIFSLAASSLFYIPFWRHFMAWIGSVPATRDNFKLLLKKDSVAVVVGGIAEMFLLDKHRERLKLKDRRGFCKIAMEEQADGIVPVYYFGGSKVLDFGPQFMMALSRRSRMSLGILVGVAGLPIPRPQPIYMVSGIPIPVPRVPLNDPDFEKKVDQLLALVVVEVQALYERHRAEYGWADRPLLIE